MPKSEFFPDGRALVVEALQGLCAVNPELILNTPTKTIRYSKHDPSKKVTLVSGGGAGHEPAHAAFVGQGMLSAAVSGNIFASPSISQIVEVIGSAGGKAGTILIVKNYTGDVFHFHLAAERARAKWGHPVEVLVVGDDVAVGRKRSGKVGRRGLAGTVLVHKILGALAAEGKSLDELMKVGRQVVDSLVTCGVSRGHVHIPGTEDLDEKPQLELGMGIHNEPGCYVLDDQTSLDDVLDKILDLLLRTDDEDRAFVDFQGQKPVLLVNNLGGTSQLELSAILHRTVTKLGNRGVQPIKVLSGTLMTSLNASGFSVTLLKATDDMISALEALTSAVGWPRVTNGPYSTENIKSDEPSSSEEKQVSVRSSGPKVDFTVFSKAVTAACESVIKAESDITHSDQLVGDGDCGITLSRGAKAVQTALTGSSQTAGTASEAIGILAAALGENMDGTSGALYEMFFTSFSTALQEVSDDSVSVQTWAKAASVALQRLQAMTPARVGDRTLMDALIPFIETLADGDFQKAVEAAKAGCDKTLGMEASLGRAVYVEGGNWGKVRDPGAQGVVAILEGLLGSL